MMNLRNGGRCFSLLLTLAMVASPLLAQERTLGPLIRQNPVTVAARGRPLGLTVKVTPRGAPVKRVTIYYTPSRDISPSKIPMVPTRNDLYVGTMPSHHLARGQEVWYYIEAIDDRDEWTESPWQRVALRDEGDPGSTQPAPQPQAVAPVQPVDSDSGGVSTKTVIIGGAVVAGAAIAVAVAASGGGGGGGGDTPSGDSSGECSRSAVSGTWTGTNPSVAPGFVLNPDGSAVFFDAQNPVPDRGSWGLIDCALTLAPLSNTVYRGAGNVSADQRHVTINGNGFTK